MDYRNLCHLVVENPTDHLLWAQPCTWCRPFLNTQEQARNIVSTKHFSGLQEKHHSHPHSSHNRAAGGATFRLVHEQWIDSNRTWLVLATPTELFGERTIQKYSTQKSLTCFRCKNIKKKLSYQEHEIFEESTFLKRHFCITNSLVNKAT